MTDPILDTEIIRPVPSAAVVKRQNELFDLYGLWPSGEDPDDDEAFVEQAHAIMGLPALLPAIDSGL